MFDELADELIEEGDALLSFERLERPAESPDLAAVRVTLTDARGELHWVEGQVDPLALSGALALLSQGGKAEVGLPNFEGWGARLELRANPVGTLVDVTLHPPALHLAVSRRNAYVLTAFDDALQERIAALEAALAKVASEARRAEIRTRLRQWIDREYAGYSWGFGGASPQREVLVALLERPVVGLVGFGPLARAIEAFGASVFREGEPTDQSRTSARCERFRDDLRRAGRTPPF